MGKRNILFKALSSAAIIALFAITSISYFAPQLGGKELRMHDIVQYDAMHQDISGHRAQYDEDPQWAGRMFGGMPSYLIYFVNDSMLLKQLSNDTEAWWRPASLIFMAMVGFWLMLSLFGVNRWLGAVFAIAYGLSSYTIIIIGAGHISKTLALAYAPMLIGAVYYAYKRNMWMGAALTALFASLEISANHYQITYYFLFVLFALWINEAVAAYKSRLISKFAKTTALLLLAGVVGVGSNLSNLWYIQQHSADTIRGGTELTPEVGEEVAEKGLSLEYATAWSYGKTESINMLIPGFMGGASGQTFDPNGEVADVLSKYNARQAAAQLPTYWGDQPGTAGPTYIGVVMIFLAVFALFLLGAKYTYWVVAVSILAIFLAWGQNMMWFTELFFNYFPLYNKFRTVSMILVIIQWSVPLLAALGVAKIWSGEYTKEQAIGALKKSVMVVGGLSLALLLFGGMLFGFSAPYDVQFQLPEDVLEAMRSERASIMKLDAFRALVLTLLTAVVVWLFAKNKIKRAVVVISLLALTCVDLIPVGLRFLPQSRFEEPKSMEVNPTSADIEILKDKTPGYRVLNRSVNTFNDATTSYYHRSVGGYHAAKLQRYQDLIDRHLLRGNQAVFDMLNTKYVITRDAESGALEVQLNEGAFGAAWFVREILFVEGADQEIEALNIANLREVAVVDRVFEEKITDVEIAVDSMASVDLTDYKVNHLTYRSNSTKDGVVLFSEIFYDKGWSAWIDGVEVPYFRADYVLRALSVPAGEHLIEFKFRAPNYSTLSTITLIFSLIIIAGAVAVSIFLVLNKKESRKDGE